MARKKKATSSKTRGKQAPAGRKPRRTKPADAPPLRERLASGAESAARAATALLLLAIAVSWIVGEARLRTVVADVRADPLQVRFNWPDRPGAPASWLPDAVRAELEQVALASLTVDPFDHDALERAHLNLLATGWPETVHAVRRLPRGVVEVDADWRVPAAVVRADGREFLVAEGGEILRDPGDQPYPRDQLFVIAEPSAPPPIDERGRLIMGIPWPNHEVQPAIDLLREVARLPSANRVVGVDLRDYDRTGDLVLVSDLGARLVFGSPLGELAPGEVDAAARLRRLEHLLAHRLDADQPLIELHLPRGVIVDRTIDAR